MGIIIDVINLLTTREFNIEPIDEKIESGHSALKQKIGDAYHYYVALYFMLNNANWNSCDIEKNGDIALRNEQDEIISSIEVKYHGTETELNDNSIELWKTIHNFYNDSDKYIDLTNLELFTVSTISEENTLYCWNKLSPEDKINLLKKSSLKKENIIYKTIEKYHTVIFKDENILSNILLKFKITSNQYYYEDYKNKILENAIFRIFNTVEKKEYALSSLTAVIISALKNVETWTVSKIDFDNKLSEIAKLSQDLIIRDDSDVEDVYVDEEQFKESNFVKKLEDIEQDEFTIADAIDDYAKTIYEVKERMNLVSTFDYHKRITNYEKSLIREYRTTKSAITPNNDRIIEQSKEFYRRMQDLQKVPFIGKSIEDKTTFFQRGYYHILANDDNNKIKIHWHLRV